MNRSNCRRKFSAVFCARSAGRFSRRSEIREKIFEKFPENLPKRPLALPVMGEGRNAQKLRQRERVSCQSKILPRCHNSLSAHSAPSESCWGVPSPNPALRSLTAAATSPSGRAFASSIAAQGFENRPNCNQLPQPAQKNFSHRYTQQTADFCPLKSERAKHGTKPGADSLSKVERFSEIFL